MRFQRDADQELDRWLERLFFGAAQAFSRDGARSAYVGEDALSNGVDALTNRGRSPRPTSPFLPLPRYQSGPLLFPPTPFPLLQRPLSPSFVLTIPFSSLGHFLPIVASLILNLYLR